MKQNQTPTASDEAERIRAHLRDYERVDYETLVSLYFHRPGANDYIERPTEMDVFVALRRYFPTLTKVEWEAMPYVERSAYLQQAVALVNSAAPATDAKPDEPARHSLDFRSVNWFGTKFTFTKSQAACVKVLWDAWKAGTPEMDGVTVTTTADVSQCRLLEVFRSDGKAHPAWNTMIVPGGTKGAYRLADGTAVPACKTSPKESRKTTRKTHP